MTIICKFREQTSSSISYDMDIPNSSPLFRTWYTAVSKISLSFTLGIFSSSFHEKVIH